MTLYLLFAGLAVLIFNGVAYAEAALSRFSRVDVAFGLQFAFLISLSTFLATVFLFYANRFLRKHSSSVPRVSGWRTRIVVAAFVFFAGGVAVLIAATREPAEASIVSPDGPRAGVVDAELARALAAGATLFQERECVGCHRPDATGVGPTLHGLFGSPVPYPGSGAAIVDESYLREAILNPSATVAAGFPPVMPTFAGRLTEEELQALIVYVTSLSVVAHARASS
jgi:mono/diheme cytochrome c family protein